jgi:hypothetical protein
MPADNTNAAPGNGNVVAGPWGKAQATYKTSNGPKRSAQSTDEIFSAGYEQAGLRPANDNRAPDQTRKARATYTTQQQPTYNPSVRSQSKLAIGRLKKKKKSKAVTAAKYTSRKARATVANVWITAWASWWYAGFQIWFALIGNLGLAIWFAAEYIVTQFKDTSVGSIVSFTLGDEKFSSITAGVTDYILKTYGINFDPELLFIIPFALTFLLGLFQLICCWFAYVAMGLKPLSGNGGWLKSITFLLVMVGYALPILNLFPLVYLWTMTVWAYPK